MLFLNRGIIENIDNSIEFSIGNPKWNHRRNRCAFFHSMTKKSWPNHCPKEVAKLTKWNVLKIAGRHGGANYYTLNQDSGFIKAFEDLDNLIIEQMESEESKIRMAAASQEQCPVVSSLRPEGHDLSMAAQIPL
jgi:hypothetical protein